MEKFSGSGRLVSDLAEQFGVSRAAASQVLDSLVSLGLADRGPGGAFSLTRKAAGISESFKKDHELLLSFFRRLPGMDESSAESCALQYLCFMPQEGVESLISRLREREELLGRRWDIDGEGKLPELADGRYELAFNVYKAGLGELSMGDRGFVKPAPLAVTGGKGIISLRPKTIRYRCLAGPLLRGRISSLSCLHDGGYAKLPMKDGAYSVPLDYMTSFSRAPDGTLCGTLRIRAEAGKCSAFMPASEADIVFLFA